MLSELQLYLKYNEIITGDHASDSNVMKSECRPPNHIYVHQVHITAGPMKTNMNRLKEK